MDVIVITEAGEAGFPAASATANHSSTSSRGDRFSFSSLFFPSRAGFAGPAFPPASATLAREPSMKRPTLHRAMPRHATKAIPFPNKLREENPPRSLGRMEISSLLLLFTCLANGR